MPSDDRLGARSGTRRVGDYWTVWPAKPSLFGRERYFPPGFRAALAETLASDVRDVLSASLRADALAS